MAFGVSPKHEQQVSLNNLTQQHFLTLMIEAARQQGWNIGHISETSFVAYTGFSMSSTGEEVKLKIDGDTATIKSQCIGNQILDYGKNKRNINDLLATFTSLRTSLSVEEIEAKYNDLHQNLLIQDQDLSNEPPQTTQEKFKNVLSFFVPTEGYFITPILINLNILIFVLMVVSGVNFLTPDNESLIKWGANFSPATLDGGWWRLITNCFLHIGVFHLLMNMYALGYIGVLLEPHLGKAKFAAAYLLTGITASLCSVWWHSLIISAGASGAIFGMYGVFLAMLTTSFIEASARKALLTSIGIFVGYNLLNGMKAGIDNAAHIGGLAGGLIIGYAYVPALKQPGNFKLNNGIIAALCVIILTGSTIVYKRIPNALNEYDEKMKSFSSRESMALEVYKMANTATKEAFLEELKDRGIYYWTENIKLINELDKLNLPDELHERDRKLLQYCELRVKTYQFVYKAVNEQTEKYKDSIETYNSQVKDILDDLKQK